MLYLCSYTDTPETAFTQAIVSAAYVSVIARKCKQQSLRKCSCDSTPKTRPADGSFFWGGCGDNFEYGYRFTKELGDRAFVGLERDLEPSELMIQHNFEAGRKVSTYTHWTHNKQPYLLYTVEPF